MDEQLADGMALALQGTSGPQGHETTISAGDGDVVTVKDSPGEFVVTFTTDTYCRLVPVGESLQNWTFVPQGLVSKVTA